MSASPSPLWTPSAARASSTQLARFRDRCALRHDLDVRDYRALHRWSVDQSAAFWAEVWDFADVVGERGERVLEPTPERAYAARWFPDARLSFAENLLRGAGERVAIVALREDGTRTSLTLDELRGEVGRWHAALCAMGVGPGSSVAGWIGNGPEAVAAMLGTTAVGARWSSCSPDFGPSAVLERFQQIEPRVLVAVDGYHYGGKSFTCRERLAEIVAGLPSLERVVMFPWSGTSAALPPRCETPAQFLGDARAPLTSFERFPFDHPLVVVYSSGTTGKPKCIVHGAGGVLLQHLKEHRLQCDVRRDDRVFFHTTCGWMMWNWLVSALASEATVVLYDGSPLHPPARLLDLAVDERVTFFGSSARHYDVLRRDGLRPRGPLAELRTVASTGSPLARESFEYVQRVMGPDVHLASISGGTDILSCFVGGDPTGSVWSGEIQAPGLGMDVDVYDPAGAPLARGPGELVCRPPFPSQPLGFVDDPDDARFRATYFSRFGGAWCQGDWAEWTEHGGIVIHGRSDATLNVHGVRIGTAEIYRELERFEEVVEGVAVECGSGATAGIALFVRLREAQVLDDELRARLRRALHERRSPRHVPRHIVQVADLPRTRSGKVSELALRDTLRGRTPPNLESLANPDSLEALRGLALD